MNNPHERQHSKRKYQYFKKIGPFYVKEYFKQVPGLLKTDVHLLGLAQCGCTLMHLKNIKSNY